VLPLHPLTSRGWPSAAAGSNQRPYPGGTTQAPSCQLLTMVQWFQQVWRLLLHRFFSSHDLRVSHRRLLPYFFLFVDLFFFPVGTFIHCKFYFYLFVFFTHTAEVKEICESRAVLWQLRQEAALQVFVCHFWCRKLCHRKLKKIQAEALKRNQEVRTQTA